MGQLPFQLLGLLTFLLMWTAVGHGIWVLCASLLRKASKRLCPDCKEQLFQSDKACRKCGWTSRPVNRATAMQVCQFALKAAFERGIIDKETLDRAAATLQQLELSLSGKGKTSLANPTPPLEPKAIETPSAQVPPVTAATAATAEAEGDRKPASLAQTNANDSTLVEATLVPILETPSSKREVSPPESSIVGNIGNVAAELPPVLVPAGVPSQPQPPPHALDRDYPAARKPELPRIEQIKQTWGKWLNAFMEEKNIQWGELAGGLLILCCSTALVLSFWEHIASRPWLKFSIFTGINAALLGLGLNACHRWKLPTTSRGILMIGLLLLPLNFLAFAIFTLGAPWDWWTVIGECLSLGLLGCLAWYAAKVVTPRCELITTATMVGFAIANLLVRRLVDAETGTTTLFLGAGALVSFYATSMLLGKRLLHLSDRSDVNALFRLLSLGSFGFVIAMGLLLGCSGSPLRSTHYLSPLFWIAATPSLIYALSIGLREPKKSKLLLASILLGSCAIGFACFGVAFAWPMPLLMVACLLGLGLQVALGFQKIQTPKLGFVWYLIGGCLTVIGWHVARGHVALLSENSLPMLRGIASADTGFVLVSWSLVCMAFSVMQSKLGRAEHGLIALKSASLNGIVGTILLTVFGFGRYEYSTSVASIYILYAVALIVVSTLRAQKSLEVIAGAFVVAACFQGIMFGWLQEAGILASCYWSLTAAAFILIIAVCIRRNLVGKREKKQTNAPEPLAAWYRGVAILDIAIAILWLAMSESGIARPEVLLIGVMEIVLLATIWVTLSWLESKALDWTVAQGIGLTAGLVWIHHYAKQQSWYEGNPFGFVHPMSLQLDIAWMAFFASISLLSVAIAMRWGSARRASDDSETFSQKVQKRFVALHDYSFAPGLLIFDGAKFHLFGVLWRCTRWRARVDTFGWIS